MRGKQHTTAHGRTFQRSRGEQGRHWRSPSAVRTPPFQACCRCASRNLPVMGTKPSHRYKEGRMLLSNRQLTSYMTSPARQELHWLETSRTHVSHILLSNVAQSTKNDSCPQCKLHASVVKQQRVFRLTLAISFWVSESKMLTTRQPTDNLTNAG